MVAKKTPWREKTLKINVSGIKVEQALSIAFNGLRTYMTEKSIMSVFRAKPKKAFFSLKIVRGIVHAIVCYL